MQGFLVQLYKENSLMRMTFYGPPVTNVVTGVTGYCH